VPQGLAELSSKRETKSKDHAPSGSSTTATTPSLLIVKTGHHLLVVSKLLRTLSTFVPF
jgi:hypothetical protein